MAAGDPPTCADASAASTLGIDKKWWPETGSNRRRRPFQGRALPLSYLALAVLFPARALFRTAKFARRARAFRFACLWGGKSGSIDRWRLRERRPTV